MTRRNSLVTWPAGRNPGGVVYGDDAADDAESESQPWSVVTGHAAALLSVGAVVAAITVGWVMLHKNRPAPPPAAEKTTSSPAAIAPPPPPPSTVTVQAAPPPTVTPTPGPSVYDQNFISLMSRGKAGAARTTRITTNVGKRWSVSLTRFGAIGPTCRADLSTLRASFIPWPKGGTQGDSECGSRPTRIARSRGAHDTTRGTAVGPQDAGWPLVKGKGQSERAAADHSAGYRRRTVGRSRQRSGDGWFSWPPLRSVPALASPYS